MQLFNKDIEEDFDCINIENSFLYIYVKCFSEPIPSKQSEEKGPFDNDLDNLLWQSFNPVIAGFFSYNAKNSFYIKYFLKLLSDHSIYGVTFACQTQDDW